MVPELTADISALAAPGSLLKQKRIELGWPVEKVAGSLLLSNTQIESIERDDYGSLSGATYVLGYWRSYSALLGLDIEESIELHKGQLKNPLSAITLEANHQKAQGHQEKNRKRSAFVFLLLSGIFLSIIWVWQNPEDNPFNQCVDNMSNTRLAKLAPQEEGLQVIGGVSAPTVGEDQVEHSTVLPEPNFSDEYQDDAQSLGEIVVSVDSASSQSPEQPDSTDNELLTSSSVSANAESGELQIADTQAVDNPPDNSQGASNQSTSDQVIPNTDEELLVQNSALLDSSNTPLVSITEQQGAENNLGLQSGLVTIEQPGEAGASILQQSGDESIGDSNNALTLNPDSSTPNSSTVVSGGANIGGLPSQDDGLSTSFDPLSPHSLELLVETETWIDVRDVTGEKLIYQTVESGQRLNLKGEPPFYVFIGTSSGVSVNYMGEPVAFKPHSSGLFARFKLGELQE